jgi:hypothetical protein
MPDNLREYIEKHRDEMEVYPFDVDSGWEALSTKIHPVKKRNSLYLWRSIAATLLILLMASLGILYQQVNHRVVYPMELIEAQYYYQTQIDQMMTQVKGQAPQAEAFEDIARLDEAFEELKADLNDDVQNEEVVAAMIDNYRLKLKILERILEEIEDKDYENYPTL